MARRTLERTLVSALLVAFVFAGCGKDKTTGPPDEPPVDNRVSDFSLPDVNPTSASFGSDVSPRDFEGAISAWYFGHAT